MDTFFLQNKLAIATIFLMVSTSISFVNLTIKYKHLYLSLKKFHDSIKIQGEGIFPPVIPIIFKREK